jgi:hypothetical protein
MLGQKLNVEKLKSALPESLHEVDQRDLRRIAPAREHRFAGKKAANGHPIDPPG